MDDQIFEHREIVIITENNKTIYGQYWWEDEKNGVSVININGKLKLVSHKFIQKIEGNK